MLQALPSHDRKWMKTDIQSVFTEGGLAKLWCELVKGGELTGISSNYRDHQLQEAESIKYRKSPFESFLAQWTWGDEPGVDQLKESLRVLVQEQQDLAHKAVLSTQSLGRLHQRIVVMERFLLASSRKGMVPEPVAVVAEGQVDVEEKEEKEEKEEEETAVKSELVPRKKKKEAARDKKPSKPTRVEERPLNMATQGLARVGAHAALSFMFAFLKRAWQSGEASELCGEVLQDALVVMKSLPVALLFDVSSMSPIWLEVVDRSMKFLMDMQKSCYLEEKMVPLDDRQVAISVLLELTLQRATLSHILEAVLLLLQLSDLAPSAPDKNRRAHKLDEKPTKGRSQEFDEQESDHLTVYPLASYLRRLAAIPTPSPPSPRPNEGHDIQHDSGVSKSYLESHILPNDDSTQLELSQVTALAMAHLDRLAEPYNLIHKLPEGGENELVQVFRLGGSAEGVLAERLVEMKACQVVSSEKHCLALCDGGTVCEVEGGTSPTNMKEVQFPKEVEIVQLAHHPLGKHFLALSSNGQLFSWGSGESGQLGHRNNQRQEGPTLVNALLGKNVVHVVAGTSHSVAVTEEGSLYTWGKGARGRLGHGGFEDKTVPTLVEKLVGHKIVDVDCGSEDAHMLALEDTGVVWSWGDGDFGKLGTGTNESCKVPKVASALKDVVRVRCGAQFSVALTKTGQVYTWGSGQYSHLGHGHEEHQKFPKKVAALSEEKVVGVAVGAHHVLTLSENGCVHGWGKNSSEEVDETGEEVPLPKLLSQVSNCGAVEIFCGANETFVFCKHHTIPLGKRLPFCLDVCPGTFEKLDLILQTMCDSLNGELDGHAHDDQGVQPPQSREEEECIAVSALNLLKLQLYSANQEKTPPSELGFTSKSALFASLKHCVVELARNTNVLPSVQQAAQAVLRTGWKILLPTISERASTLLHLLPVPDCSDNAREELPLPAGQQFMIDLLLSSLTVEQDMEEALLTAVAYETQDPAAMLKKAGLESSVALMQLIHQLISNSTVRQLALLNKVTSSKDSEEPVRDDNDKESDFFSTNRFFLLFQKVLLSNLYSNSTTSPPPPPSPLSPHPEVTSTASPFAVRSNTDHTHHYHYAEGAMNILVKYISLLQDHVTQVLKEAVEYPQHFRSISKILMGGPVMTLLPSLSVGLVLLQMRVPYLLGQSHCLEQMDKLVEYLDKFNRRSPSIFVEESEDLNWPGTKTDEGAVPVVTREELDRHNDEEGGDWVVIHGRVYSTYTLAKELSCDGKKLAELVGKDASKEFDLVHSISKEQLHQFSVGLYKDEDHGCDYTLLLDTERALAVLQGLRACSIVQGPPVLLFEEESEKHLSLEIFSSGVESKPLLSSHQAGPATASGSGAQRRPSVLPAPQSFLYSLSSADPQDERVVSFLLHVQKYCRRRNLYLPHSEQPLVKFGNLFMACLLKMHDLVPLALSMVEQEGPPNNEQDSVASHFPPLLAEICKLVHDAKLSLVKTHQESLCSYEEVCREPIARCSFLVDHIKSPMLNVTSILHKYQIQGVSSRWRGIVRCDVLAQRQRQRQQQEGKSVELGTDSHSEKPGLGGQRVPGMKTVKEAMNLYQMDPEIAGGRKFKWLREKKGIASQRATLQAQIKNFVLMDEVDIRSLHKTLQRQMVRARSRKEGFQYLRKILQQEFLLPSVKYAIICGWLGTFSGPSEGKQQLMGKAHCLCNVERVPPLLRAELELEVHNLNDFMTKRLRGLLYEAKKLVRRQKQRKKDGDKAHDYATAKYTISRFVVATLGMLTAEHSDIEISHLLNSGLLGLSQSAVKLAGTVPSTDDALYEEVGPNRVPYLKQDVLQEEDDLEGVASRFQVGTVVVRGPDWKWGDQDGVPPGRGVVVSELSSSGWLRVKWEVSGSVNIYRMSQDGKFDIALAPDSAAEEGKDSPVDTELTAGMTTPYPAQDMVTGVILQSSVCLLRSIVVAFSIHAHHFPDHTSSILSNLLYHIVECAKKKRLRTKSDMNIVSAQECEMWATLGLLRGVASPDGSGRAFCNHKWVELLINAAKKVSPLSSHPHSKSLVQEVLMLRLLRTILPSWEGGANTRHQQKVVEDLFSLLGQVLVLCSSPFVLHSTRSEHKSKKKKIKFNAAMHASESSTIAEEVVVLLRRLHPLPAWNDLINKFIGNSLQHIPNIIMVAEEQRSASGSDSKAQTKRDVDTNGPVLAVLTVIGGLDSRPRLGGLVQHEGLGMGTVAQVEGKGKTTVFFHEQKKAKTCVLSTVKPIPVLSFQVDRLPMNETVMGIWSCLVRLAGNSALPSRDQSSLFQPPSSKKTPKASLPAVPEDGGAAAKESIYIPLLRQEQIRLGLLKAARVLFSQKENLRQIMARPASAEGDQFSLFQQLLSAATRPSPVKAIFSRDELEAAAVSMCQYLASEVHSPHTETSQATAKEAEESNDTKKKLPPTKKVSKPFPSPGTQPKAPTAVAPAKLPPPSPVVSQLMEMGFDRRYIEYAIQTTKSTSPQRLINWLIEHQDIEIPEASLVPPAPVHPPDTPPTSEPQASGRKHEETESSSDSEDSDVGDAEDTEGDGTHGSKGFKKRADFSSQDDYARYIRDNISVGTMVQCCDGYEEVQLGDVGRIMKVDNDGLHDLNVQANWQQKGGTYWVRFCHCELLGDIDVAGVMTFKPGDKVRVKAAVTVPKYKWGLVTHQSVGKVRNINKNGTDVSVDFTEQNNWTGLISEMELVPGVHPRHKCDGCGMAPIEGPRFHCQVCANFDFCQSCFNKGQSHNHAFERVDDHGQSAVYVGSPRSLKKALKRKKKKMRGGFIVMEWDQIVRQITVSSNESSAYKLMDGNHNTCWQSSGLLGKHWIRLAIQPNILVEQLSLLVEMSDSTYMPNLVAVMAGNAVGSLREIRKVAVSSTAREYVLVTGLTEYYPWIEIAIRSCKSGGIDTKIHGVSIIGRMNMNEEEVAASFSLLSVEEAEGKEVGLIRRQRKIDESQQGDCSPFRVFVWGLNDKHQLGCLQSDIKIKTPVENKSLAKLHPVYIVGGSKTLFVVSQDGKVYSCGEGTNGRLGDGGTADVPAPRVLADLSMYVVKKVAVSAGSRHAMALTADGKVFSWGDGEYGQLGHGDNKSYSRPRMIESLQGKHVREVSCGSGHSAAITANGELYTWGRGDHGRLGHGDEARQSKPKQVKCLESHRIMLVACGSRDAHTLAASENGLLFVWGDSSYGKLGQKGLEGHCLQPVKVKDFKKEGIAHLECGMQFSVLLTKSGKIYTWGKGDYYRLGSDSSSHVTEPRLVEGISDKVVQVAVGAMHCLALTETGEVYSWGDNEHGQQGNGSTMSNKKPQLVSSLAELHISRIACGSSHSIALASGKPPSTVEYTPVPYSTARDPLATATIITSSSRQPEDTSHLLISDSKCPSLIKIIMSLRTPLKQQEALAHVLTALQIAYARDAIINSLGGVVSVYQKGPSEEEMADILVTGPISPEVLGGPVELYSPVVATMAGQKTMEAVDFTSMLTVEDARVMVDLLKLAVANRVGEKGRENLAAILTAMAKANPIVAEMLMDLCVSELESVTREPNETPKPVVQESIHPYPDNLVDSKTVRMPGAEALLISFDPQCSTERRKDILTIKDVSGTVVASKSGRDFSDWNQGIRILGDEMTWTFKSDGSVNGWGFRLTVHPLMPKKSSTKNLLSDQALQSRPSVDLVMCLLDFQLGLIPGRDTLNQLGAALASCAQLQVLEASQRMWAIEQLRRLIDTASTVPLSGGIMASLHSLVRGLPEALIKQYNYETPHISDGSQLMHSSFFQSMVGLACDLKLDSMDCCKDEGKWGWFKQYCIAARIAKALQRRTAIPAECLMEFNERLQALQFPPGVTPPGSLHESNSLFKEKQDEQLLLWTQRYPNDWSIPLWNTCSVYAWGHNHRGQLGGLVGRRISVPKLSDSFSEVNPVQIIGGEQSVFTVTKDGKVYASGCGAYGRLGTGCVEDATTPTLISSFVSRGVSIRKVEVHPAGKHCLAITTQGELYAWGEGDNGRLGIGKDEVQDSPQLVEVLKEKKVVDAACGATYSACILEDGSLYTWGKGRYGRLGHNDLENYKYPKQVMALKHEQVISVALGNADAQTLCATASGNVYSWGDGDFGKLGRGGNDSCRVPKKIDSLCGKEVTKVMCGSQFSAALTQKGHLYTWGKGEFYRLGHNDDSHQRTPKRVLGLLINRKVVDFSCGSLHCMACTSDGKVFAWGDNDEHQVGNGTSVACRGPQEIRIPNNVHINHVTCGSAHSIAWSSVQKKVVCYLPEKVPIEFNMLQDLALPVLHNRLVLLQYFSSLFCSSLSLFGLGHEGAMEDGRRFLILSTAKEKAFRRVIKATMTKGKPHGPCIKLNRFQVKGPRRGMEVDGSKTVFSQMCSKWSILTQDDLLLNQRIWKVKLVGESVDDCGGGYSESIAEMCDELQNGSLPLLIQTPNGRDDTGVNRDCFIINPKATSHSHFNMFQFLGALIGIAIRTSSPINLVLAPPIWKQLVGLPLTLDDLSEIDSDYVQGLLYIRDNPESFIGIDFSAPNSLGEAVNLHHSWTHITLDNAKEYVQLSTQFRLHEFDTQVQAIREGLAKVVPVPLLALFTGAELETMVCGSREISISLLKSITTYRKVDPTAPLARWFWEVMESFNQMERSLFLRFVWGRTRLPRTASDFKGKEFVLQILDKYHPPDYYLPESYTCFFLLKLPRYSCKPVLEEKLRYAINFCKSIDTDEYARVNLQEGLMMVGEEEEPSGVE